MTGRDQPTLRMQLLASCVLASLAPASALAREPISRPNPVLEERLRDAQTTTRKLDNGATFTELKFAGSLQPNADVGCVSIEDVTSSMNAPALVYAAKKCIQQERYQQAWALLTTAMGFAYYDVKRLADRSTQGARSVLLMNAFADLPNAQRETFQRVSKELQANPETVSEYCAQLTRIGAPGYEPQWAILHGIGVYEEPRNGHYRTNIDQKAVWDEVLKNRCTPQRP